MIEMIKSLIKCCLLIVMFVLVGCATGYAPVSDLSSSSQSTSRSNTSATLAKASSKRKKYPAGKLPASYRVKRGDTLYSIAWKFGLDFKRLALINGISSNYLIYQNQKLVIKQTKKTAKAAINTPSALNGIKTALPKADIKSASKKRNKPNSSKKPIKISNKTSSKSKPLTTRKTTSKNSSKLRWIWPAKGRVVNKFSIENKGLNISGVKGEAVYAAASGTVVYAGNGIIGYGNLLIIKHSSEFLSAYAHNSVILVSENNRVKVGDKIAEIGNSGTITTILHFEIRKDGKPVNPEKYLPKK